MSHEDPFSYPRKMLSTECMENPLVLKLQRFAELCQAEIKAVKELCQGSTPSRKGDVLIRENEKPEIVRIILAGIAARIKLTEDGDRKIVGFMVPGDMCDLHAFILKKMDHRIEALNEGCYAEIPRERLLDFFERFPRVTQAMWWSTMVDESTLRQWLMNVASGTSYERTAHILAEICVRLETVGQANGEECRINLIQEDISDAVGITRSHLNESCQRLQADGFIRLHRGEIIITDVEGLKRAGRFDAEYLHLEKSMKSPPPEAISEGFPVRGQRNKTDAP